MSTLQDDGSFDAFRGHRLVPHVPSPYPGTRGAYRCSHYACDYHVVVDDDAKEGIVIAPAAMPNASIVGPRTATMLEGLPATERRKIIYCPVAKARAFVPR